VEVKEGRNSYFGVDQFSLSLGENEVLDLLEVGDEVEVSIGDEGRVGGVVEFGMEFL